MLSNTGTGMCVLVELRSCHSLLRIQSLAVIITSGSSHGPAEAEIVLCVKATSVYLLSALGDLTKEWRKRVSLWPKRGSRRHKLVVLRTPKPFFVLWDQRTSAQRWFNTLTELCTDIKWFATLPFARVPHNLGSKAHKLRALRLEPQVPSCGRFNGSSNHSSSHHTRNCEVFSRRGAR